MRKLVLPIGVTIFFACLLSGAIYLRFNEIEKSNNIQYQTFPQIYSTSGKPIEVYDVKKDSLALSVKVSGVVKNDKTLEVFVEREIHKALKVKDTFVGLNKFAKISGKILRISSNVDLSTGLYKVYLKSTSQLPPVGSLIPVEVNVRNVRGRIVLPIGAVSPRKGKVLVWKVLENAVKSVEVEVGLYNEKYVEITSGIIEGDRVVIKGASLLEDSDKYRIVN